MKKLLILIFTILCTNSIISQTMYVRPLSGSQTSYSVENIQKLTFENGNLIVTNETGPSSTYSLSNNRYINFIDLTLGINTPIATENKFFVYPNPSSQWLNIGNTNSNQTPNLVEIISLEGKLLIQRKPTETDTQIDISSLPQGMYLCKITSGNKSQIIKFLKK